MIYYKNYINKTIGWNLQYLHKVWKHGVSTSKFVLFTTNLHFRQQRAPNFAKFWSGKLWGIGKGSLSWFYCKSFCIFVKNEEFCIFWHQEKDFSLIFCIFCIFLKTPYLTRRIWGETGCT
jgi:hypothetical protein